MKRLGWQHRLAVALIAMAVLFYAARWLAFPAPVERSEMWRFMLGDIAFLFVQVPLVTLVIDGLIRRRQRDEMRKKLNMIIGAFFSETGTNLLGQIAVGDAHLAEVRSELVPAVTWTGSDFARSRHAFHAHRPEIDIAAFDLERLRSALESERPFMIGLLANQALLEHETFSDLLWALTHLGEELSARPDLSAFEPPDASHIALDIRRAYRLLGVEWLSYMQHLKSAYPFLFSLAIRTNPLDPEARAAFSS